VEKIYLRPLKEDDINETYVSWFNDPDVVKYLEVGREGPFTREKGLDYFKEGIEKKSHFIYAVCLKENNQQIGTVKIGPLNNFHKNSDLVVIIGDKSQWGKGYAPDALSLGLKLAFEKYEMRKIYGGIYSGNLGSLKAYTKAGYTIEATQKDHALIDGKIQDLIRIAYFNPKYYKKTNENEWIRISKP